MFSFTLLLLWELNCIHVCLCFMNAFLSGLAIVQYFFIAELSYFWFSDVFAMYAGRFSRILPKISHKGRSWGICLLNKLPNEERHIQSLTIPTRGQKPFPLYGPCYQKKWLKNTDALLTNNSNQATNWKWEFIKIKLVKSPKFTSARSLCSKKECQTLHEGHKDIFYCYEILFWK